MSYFNGPANPDDYDDGIIESEGQAGGRAMRAKINIGIFLLVMGVLGSTFAANISLSGGRTEFGQGIFQVRACDQWIGINLVTGANVQNPYVTNVEILGLDPRACRGTILRIKLFKTGNSNPLPIFVSGGPSGTLSDSVTATSVVTKITTAAYTGNNQTAYGNWAFDAMTLIDPQGRDIGYSDDYQFVDYSRATGKYVVILTYPRLLAADVNSLTIETAKYS
jgi:hypothetical protein